MIKVVEVGFTFMKLVVEPAVTAFPIMELTATAATAGSSIVKLIRRPDMVTFPTCSIYDHRLGSSFHERKARRIRLGGQFH